MRVRHKALVTVTEDADGRNRLFAPDDSLAEVVLDGMTESTSGTAVVAATETFPVPFAAISDVRGIYLRGTADFALSLNGGPAVNVKRGVTGAGGVQAATARVFLEAMLTSVQVVAGAAPVTLTWCAWGDPVA